MTSEAIGQTEPYPLTLEIHRPETQSRLTNFPLGIGLLIRAILLIPHLIIIYFLQIVGVIIVFIAQFAILFTGRFPLGMFTFYVGYMRWSANIGGYLGSLYDKYSPFSLEAQPEYPLVFDVEYPESLNRILNFPLGIGILIKTILTIPHLIILVFLVIAALVVVLIAQFAILFTGAFPAGMHRFVVGVTRWLNRVNAYTYSLTDKYPPFSLD
jgi:hypothetical protein